jgi:hypothetical protein
MADWDVVETPCYPCAFTTRAGAHWDNSTSNFFRTREEAQTEADRRNAKESDL